MRTHGRFASTVEHPRSASPLHGRVPFLRTTMWSRQSFHDEHVLSSAYFFIVTFLLLISFFLQHWTKHVAKLSIPEAIVPITVGIAVSATINFCGGYSQPSRYSLEEGSTAAMGSLANFDARYVMCDCVTMCRGVVRKSGDQLVPVERQSLRTA